MNRILNLAIFALNSLLATLIVLSLPWRFQHDSPIMLYIAFLMDHFGYVPYHNIFDMNMPGAYIAYYFIGKLSGYSDIGVRFADLFILITLCIVNWLWMRKISNKVAWLGSVSWGLIYLGFGPGISLQREYLILLPVIIGIFLYSRLSEKNIARNLVVGFFFGIASTMKPHAGIGLFAFIFLDLLNIWQKKKNLKTTIVLFIKNFSLMMISFSVPFLIILFYLVRENVVGDFLEIAINYWPLYTHLNGNHTTFFGFSRIIYLFQNWRYLGGFTIWLAPAAIGSYITFQQPMLKAEQKDQVIILIGLTICYAIYPIFSGQFWLYHWLIFLFFIIQLASLCLIEQSKNTKKQWRLYPIIVIFSVIFFTFPIEPFFTPWQYLLPPEGGRADEIVAFLKPKLQPEDTIQPLDWTSGAVHAMLMLNSKIATPYIYDFYFYHNVSNGYIQNLRKNFIADLKTSRPRFIIDMIGEFKPWPNGIDTTKDFSELKDFLDKNYTILSTGNGYLIYELRDSSGNK